MAPIISLVRLPVISFVDMPHAAGSGGVFQALNTGSFQHATVAHWNADTTPRDHDHSLWSLHHEITTIPCDYPITRSPFSVAGIYATSFSSHKLYIATSLYIHKLLLIAHPRNPSDQETIINTACDFNQNPPLTPLFIKQVLQNVTEFLSIVRFYLLLLCNQISYSQWYRNKQLNIWMTLFCQQYKQYLIFACRGKSLLKHDTVMSTSPLTSEWVSLGVWHDRDTWFLYVIFLHITRKNYVASLASDIVFWFWQFDFGILTRYFCQRHWKGLWKQTLIS